MIDAGGYHDVNISCTDPNAAITERVWVELNNQTTSSVDVAQAISDGLTTTTEDALVVRQLASSGREEFLGKVSSAEEITDNYIYFDNYSIIQFNYALFD